MDIHILVILLALVVAVEGWMISTLRLKVQRLEKKIGIE